MNTPPRKILITGANGQLGSEFRHIADSRKDDRFTLTDIDELDVTDWNQVKEFCTRHSFECIINCAGYTAVDQAEKEKARAMHINADAVRNLAFAARECQAILVHISTDYVFDGRHYLPYLESDRENPLSWYGLSKLEGERQVLMNADKALIFRTSWLYSSTGLNFLKSILKKGSEQKEINVVCDQVGTPTYAADLASAILTVLPSFTSREKRIYHYSNEGIASWYDFAYEIIQQAGLDCRVLPVASSAYPTTARRPYYSVLNKEKIKRDFGMEIPHWKEALQRCLRSLLQS